MRVFLLLTEPFISIMLPCLVEEPYQEFIYKCVTKFHGRIFLVAIHLCDANLHLGLIESDNGHRSAVNYGWWLRRTAS